jgi:hypothetical protein
VRSILNHDALPLTNRGAALEQRAILWQAESRTDFRSYIFG